MKDRGAWHAIVHGVAGSQTWLRDWTNKFRGEYAQRFNFPYIYMKIYAKYVSMDFPGVHWWSTYLPMQKTWVESLLREHSRRPRGTRPVYYNNRAHVPQLLMPAHTRAQAPQQEKSLQREASRHNWRAAPLSAMGESHRASMKMQHRQISVKLMLYIYIYIYF